jgi:hypothetical protein
MACGPMSRACRGDLRRGTSKNDTGLRQNPDDTTCDDSHRRRSRDRDMTPEMRIDISSVSAKARLPPWTRTMLSLSVMKQLPLMSAAAGLRIVMARYGQWDGPVRSTEGCEGTSKPQKDKNIRSAVFLEGARVVDLLGQHLVDSCTAHTERAHPTASFQVRNANGARRLLRRREQIVPSRTPELPDPHRERRAHRGRGRPWPSSR